MSTDPNINNFVGLSSILTGFTQEELAPAIDPIGLASEYLNWILQQLQEPDRQTFLKVLSTYQDIAAQFPPPLDPVTPDATQVAEISGAVQQQILSDSNMAAIARRIIRLWYLATWYVNEPPNPTDSGTIPSANAYTLGLAWDAAQAHPMGYSELHFGYWATQPPPNDVSSNAFPTINMPDSSATASTEAPPRVALQRGGI
jgi:hypothetical protein